MFRTFTRIKANQFLLEETKSRTEIDIGYFGDKICLGSVCTSEDGMQSMHKLFLLPNEWELVIKDLTAMLEINMLPIEKPKVCLEYGFRIYPRIS